MRLMAIHSPKVYTTVKNYRNGNPVCLAVPWPAAHMPPFSRPAEHRATARAELPEGNEA
jgi:hypothetical protein